MPRWEPAEAEKRCPDCAELIKARATLCRFCGRHFDPTEIGEQIDQAREAFAAANPEAVTWRCRRYPECDTRNSAEARACRHCRRDVTNVPVT